LTTLAVSTEMTHPIPVIATPHSTTTAPPIRSPRPAARGRHAAPGGVETGRDDARVKVFDSGNGTASERRSRTPHAGQRPPTGTDAWPSAGRHTASAPRVDLPIAEARTPHDHLRSTSDPVRSGRPVHRPGIHPGPDWDYRRNTRTHQGGVATIPKSLSAHTNPGQYATPPSDEERYQYLRGGQKRWLLVVQYVAFLGVAISFAGFTASTYWTLIFGIPLLLSVVEQTMSLYTSTRRRRIELASHKNTVESWRPRRSPSVDVFVPTAGEELDLLDNTMRHLNRLVWPGELRIMILDDSGRASVRDLTGRYGFSYLARPGSEFKKAGNLRYGAERTNGEIVAIFDADFVPRPDFLLELAPYMDDPTVGIVQSPQFFNTSKRMNWIQRAAGSTQELFYRFIQPSRDALGAAVCVGTSALYRRTALEAIGGFPLIGHSEDIYTGLWMLDAGYSIRYVPVVVSKGITPDNLDNFIAQQYRWCEGSMTMLATQGFHTSPTLSLRARLCFWSGFLYYIGTALSSLIIPLPAITMAWFYPQWVRPWNTIWLAGTLALWLAIYPLVMRGRWRIEVLRIQTVYGFAHAFNVANLLRRRVVEWHPTGSKAPAPIAVRVKRFYTAYLGAALIAVAAGLILRTAQDGFTLFAGMLVFFLINLYVVGPLVMSGIRDEFRSVRQASAASTQTEIPVEIAA
jgi:cellulose synthase (UDP-forming)